MPKYSQTLYHLPATQAQSLSSPQWCCCFPWCHFGDDSVLPQPVPSCWAGTASTGKGLQGIISLQINNSTAASDGRHSQSCSEYDSAPNTDLECESLRLNSSKNRIEQLLETSKLHHVSWHPCIQHFGDMSCFFTLSISTFSGHQLAKKSPLFNQRKDFLLKFD